MVNTTGVELPTAASPNNTAVVGSRDVLIFVLPRLPESFEMEIGGTRSLSYLGSSIQVMSAENPEMGSPAKVEQIDPHGNDDSKGKRVEAAQLLLKEPTEEGASSQRHEGSINITINVRENAPHAPQQKTEGTSADDKATNTESKRVSKTIGIVCVFVASSLLPMFDNFPKTENGGLMYSASLTFMGLGLFASLILLIHSILVTSAAPEIVQVQKAAMVASLAFALVSLTLRACMVLPAAPSKFSWLFLLLGAGAALLYWLLTCHGCRRSVEDGDSAASAGSL